MDESKFQINSVLSNSPTEKTKISRSTVKYFDCEKLLNEIDSCKRNNVRDITVRTFKYNAIRKISRGTVRNLLKCFNKGLF